MEYVCITRTGPIPSLSRNYAIVIEPDHPMRFTNIFESSEHLQVNQIYQIESMGRQEVHKREIGQV